MTYLRIVQSNHEGAIIDAIQEARGWAEGGIVINPGAYTHIPSPSATPSPRWGCRPSRCTSSNIHAREEFRHTSVIAPVCRGQIAGFGPQAIFWACARFWKQLRIEG